MKNKIEIRPMYTGSGKLQLVSPKKLTVMEILNPLIKTIDRQRNY
jgi:hypothetical protein